jgi:hypothetical protein
VAACRMGMVMVMIMMMVMMMVTVMAMMMVTLCCSTLRYTMLCYKEGKVVK